MESIKKKDNVYVPRTLITFMNINLGFKESRDDC